MTLLISKTTLFNMALDRGLTSRGFNGRNRSRMNKRDLVEFINQFQPPLDVAPRVIQPNMRMTRATLREMAMAKGLGEGRHVGFNGRSIKYMRKKDFIEFLDWVEKNRVVEPSKDIKDTEITEDSSSRGLECKVCLTNKICVVLRKCGHAFCYSCTTRFNNKCATCRTMFSKEQVLQIYI